MTKIIHPHDLHHTFFCADCPILPPGMKADKSLIETCKAWFQDYEKAKRIFVSTGNHHLFLLVTAKSDQQWIVLLGKRKKHFPFFQTQFENATFYHLNEKKLYHAASPVLPSLKFECGRVWKMEGKEPFDFSFRFHPVDLDRREVFLKRFFPSGHPWVPGAVFRYHLLRLNACEGTIAGEKVTAAHGFSEQGNYAMLTLSDWQIPFHYRLFLEREGQGGGLFWKAFGKKPANLLEAIPDFIKKTFLKDQIRWGLLHPPPGSSKSKILATTQIPLGGWLLKRNILEMKDRHRNIWYGLEENFVLK